MRRPHSGVFSDETSEAEGQFSGVDFLIRQFIQRLSVCLTFTLKKYALVHSPSFRQDSSSSEEFELCVYVLKAK